jgi:hypothetical protein
MYANKPSSEPFGCSFTCEPLMMGEFILIFNHDQLSIHLHELKRFFHLQALNNCNRLNGGTKLNVTLTKLQNMKGFPQIFLMH